eukprot:gene9711-1916_t
MKKLTRRQHIDFLEPTKNDDGYEFVDLKAEKPAFGERENLFQKIKRRISNFELNRSNTIILSIFITFSRNVLRSEMFQNENLPIKRIPVEIKRGKWKPSNEPTLDFDDGSSTIIKENKMSKKPKKKQKKNKKQTKILKSEKKPKIEKIHASKEYQQKILNKKKKQLKKLEKMEKELGQQYQKKQNRINNQFEKDDENMYTDDEERSSSEKARSLNLDDDDDDY